MCSSYTKYILLHRSWIEDEAKKGQLRTKRNHFFSKIWLVCLASTLGYYNTRFRDGYLPISRILGRHGVVFDFTFIEFVIMSCLRDHNMHLISSAGLVDRVESFALAKKDLNFICSNEEADQVYEKLQSVKEKFLKNTKDLEIVNNKEIIKEDLARKDEKQEKFNRVWDEKRMDLEKNRQMDKAFIHLLHPTKSSLRSEMLNSVQKYFTKKLKEHERLRAIDLSGLKTKLKAVVGQVVVNDERSLHGPAHETQIVDLVRSEKGDQGYSEVAPALFENPSEA
uniref:Beta-amylase 1, chloroplastic n=1 Tax=Tanacetum cinerariifolium TaxID=118510 RepID=A0A699GUP1_TANCI|nr:beta-amylase 1, chloroplastic [Tanacetum cinerariifolium]